MSKEAVSVGIDFGTSTTVVAIHRHGQSEVILDPSREAVIPSVVAYLPSGRTHQAGRRRGSAASGVSPG